VTAKGGHVLGAVYAPLGGNDFSSFVLQAQQSRAQVIALANSSADTVNTLKQAIEFGVDRKQQSFVAYVLFISHIKAMTLAGIAPGNVEIGGAALLALSR
jgi:branched-chain amino acid transport system substrate-binding protein